MRAILLASMLATTSGVAMAQDTINAGQVVRGQFEAADRESGYCYVLETEPGQTYSVTLRSSAFDSYLAAGPGEGCERPTIFSDDRAGIGSNSSLRFRSRGGPWGIKVSSRNLGEGGDYELDVSGGERSRTPRRIDIGETLSGRLEAGDYEAEDYTYYDCYVLDVDRPARVNIRQDSRELNSFLVLYLGSRCEGSYIDSDDSSGSGESAMISRRLDPGLYSFRANSLKEREEGAYSVTVTMERR